MPSQKSQVERHSLRLHVGDAVVPAILLLPPGIERPVPAGLVLHGYWSRKERMADTIGRALANHGVASLAIDLPLHGDRDAPMQRQSLLNPMALVRHSRISACRNDVPRPRKVEPSHSAAVAPRSLNGARRPSDLGCTASPHTSSGTHSRA